MNYNKIDEIREQKKMPKMEFYELLGMTDSGYRRSIERHSLRVDTLERIAEVLEVPVTVFFDSVKTENTEPFDTEDLKNIMALKIPAEEKVKLLSEIVKLLCVTTEAQKKTININETEIQKLKAALGIS